MKKPVPCNTGWREAMRRGERSVRRSVSQAVPDHLTEEMKLFIIRFIGKFLNINAIYRKNPE
jgi:hypothetical protein